MSIKFSINKREIGSEFPPYVIAELSANHNGDIDRAKKIILEAKKAGADAVKLQTYEADTITMKCSRPEFMINEGLWKGYTLHDLYKWAETPYSWHKELFEYAEENNITCFSTPFDESAVDLLEDINTPAYKIASFEIIDLPLIEYVASTHKPMILSTGMASPDEIKEAVDIAHQSGCNQLALLHCVSGYPVPIEQSNLRVIEDLATKYNVISGLSDHTLGMLIPSVAIAMGACIIEKHVTLSREEKGPDSEFSIEPAELKELCRNVKYSWESLGSITYELMPSEISNKAYRRSLYVTKPIKAGEILTNVNVRSIRPGYGLDPKYFKDVIGKNARVDIETGTPLNWDYIE